MTPISLIGNKIFRSSRFLKGASGGFTLLEVLVAVALLGCGISQIFFILLGSVNALKHITYRMDAVTLMSAKIGEIQTRIEQPDFDQKPVRHIETIDVVPSFTVTSYYQKIDGFLSLYDAVVEVSWTEGKRPITMNRHVYLRM